METEANKTIRERFNKEYLEWDKRYEYPYNNIISYEIYRRRQLIEEFLRDLPDKPNKILEVGCGTANVISRIISLYPTWDGYGVDISEKMIQWNKDKYPHINFQCVNLDKDEEYNEDGFDIIICAGVIGYLNDPVKFLKKLNDRLKPGGILILSFGNRNSIFRKIRNTIIQLTKYPIFNLLIRPFYKANNAYHTLQFYKSYTLVELKKMLPGNLKIEEMKYLSFGSGMLGKYSVYLDRWIERVLRNSGFLSLGRNVVIKLRNAM